MSDYAYGVDLPYIAVEGSKPLTYDADLEVIEKIGGTSTGELLANYAKLFDNTWADYSYINDEDYGTVYLFEKEAYFNDFEIMDLSVK